VSDRGIYIEDLNSANGTFVNGKRIAEKTKISVGDELRFDDLAYRLTSRESGGSDATVVLSNKAVLDAVKKHQSEEHAAPVKQAPAQPSSPSPAAPVAPPAEKEPEEDGTRILSSDQLKQAAQIHQQYQAFTDTGSGPRFVATTAPIRGQIFNLGASGSSNLWKLGRSRDCDICIPAPSVSRLHSEIRKEDGRFHMKALDENKPFLFNKLPQTTAMLLKHNDHLQIGSIELIFRLDEASQASMPVKEEKDDYPMKSRIIALVAFALFTIALFGAVLAIQSSKKDPLLEGRPIKTEEVILPAESATEASEPALENDQDATAVEN